VKEGKRRGERERKGGVRRGEKGKERKGRGRRGKGGKDEGRRDPQFTFLDSAATLLSESE